MRLWSELVGSIEEAWQEFRIHKTRVLLSLIGVGVAVTALTGVVAVGAIAEQAQIETYERQGGRPAMVQLSAYNMNTGEAPEPQALEDAFARAVDRYGISWSSRMVSSGAQLQTPFGVVDASLTLVDADWGVMHRFDLEHGEWFTDRDAQRLAPAVVINEALWQQLGSPPLEKHPKLTVLSGEKPFTAVITAVSPSADWDTYPQMWGLVDHIDHFVSVEEREYISPGLELWLPVDKVDELMATVQRDIAGALGEDFQVDAYRSDYLSWYEPGSANDPMFVMRILITSAAVVVLALGALGLLNIALVTIKYRIREIGIRRSFGATSGRVFFGVMLESVVATTIAGIAGVALAVLAVRIGSETLLQGVVDDVPAFPLDAAIFGLVVSVVVGALAGLLPAIFAVRVKVIDAIRY